MKKILLSLLAASTLMPAAAQLGADGYYRVQNYVTHRWAYVTDNKGKVNVGATTADVGAIELWTGFDRAASDPASIIYIKKIDGSQYDLLAQGANVATFMDGYPKIISGKFPNTYLCYGTKSGASKYLGDIETNLSDPQGISSVDATGDYRYWYIWPVGTSSDNYFGVKPTLTADGKQYATMYASFPFSTYSAGMKAYVVDRVERGMAVIKEVTGTVPGETPVIFLCNGSDPAQNKLTIGGTGSSVGANQLRGVYFENYLKTHQNLTKYDAATMRVLRVGPDGNPAFVTANDLEYLPANQAYLRVAPGSPSYLRMVTEEELGQLAALPTSVSLNRTTKSLGVGDSFTLTATVLPSDAEYSLTWSSDNNGVAKVDASGTVTAVAKGSANITVTTQNGLTATCKVTVSSVPTSVTITPSSLTLTEFETARLTATVAPADVEDKSITWSSSDPSIATVDATGLVTAVKAGETTITAAAYNGVKSSVNVKVEAKIYEAEKIVFDKNSYSLMEGSTLTLNPTVLPENTTDKTLTWSSSDSSVATVENGVVTAVAIGTAYITATCGNVSARVWITVTRRIVNVESVTLNYEDVTLDEGDQLQLVATVLPEDHTSGDLSWRSSNSTVARVDSKGLVTARSAGNAEITVSCGGVTALCTVTVVRKPVAVEEVTLNLSRLNLTVGGMARLTAEVSPANADDKTVIWTSDNMDVATVEEGIVNALAAGEAVITASCGEVTASCIVTVTEEIAPEIVVPTAISLSMAEAHIEIGETLQLEAVLSPENVTETAVNWSSSSSRVATVNADGKVTAVGKGRTVIRATTVNGLTASCAVYVTVPVEGLEVDPTSFSSIEGTEFDITVHVLPADADEPETLSWSSSNEDVVVVNQKGHCKIVGEGNAAVTVTDGQFEARCEILGLSEIAEILAGASTADVYSLDGVLVVRGADAARLQSLPRGLYVINGRKVLK